MPTLFVAGDPLAGPPPAPEPKGIKFTQHLMPDGRTMPQWMDSPPEIAPEIWAATEAKAAALYAAGFSLHMEMLSDYRTVSFTVEAPQDRGDFAIENCPNGPGVPAAIVKLIDDATSRLSAAGLV